MAIARMNIDLEDDFLKGSPGVTSAFDHSPSRMIAYGGGDKILCAVDLTEDDDDEYDDEEEEYDDDEEEDDGEEEEDDDEEDDDDEGEEIDDEEEDIEGDDPEPGDGPRSYRLYPSL